MYNSLCFAKHYLEISLPFSVRSVVHIINTIQFGSVDVWRKKNLLFDNYGTALELVIPASMIMNNS